MKLKLFRHIAIFLLCVLLLPNKAPAEGPGMSVETAAGLIIAGVAVAGAAIGIGIYYSVSHSHHSIKGCAVSGPNGLELQNEGDHQTFLLLGITTDVKPGDVVSLKGKKTKAAKGSTSDPTFVVEKLAKNYGACKVAPAKP
jgi:hypothetical protein